MRIIRGKLAPQQTGQYPARYDVATEAYQVYVDGVWTDAPADDPRNQSVAPPLDTADPRCDAAARMAAWVNEIVQTAADQLEAGATGFTLFTGIWFLVGLFTGIWALFAALWNAVVAVLAAAGYTDLRDVFDATYLETLTCRFYAVLPANGVLTQAGLAQLQADVAANDPATASNVINAIASFAGIGLLNGMASIRTETGDCVACPDEWSHTFYADSPELDWWFPYEAISYCNNTYQGMFSGGATESNGAGHLRWIDTPGGAPSAYIIILAGQFQLPAGSTLTSIVWNSQQTVGPNLDGWHKRRWVNTSVQCWTTFYTGYNQWTGSIPGEKVVNWKISWFNGAANGYRVRVNSITISGTGIDPFVS